MAFYYYRRYYFPISVTNKWEALERAKALAKDAEKPGLFRTLFDGEWVKLVDDPGGWMKGFKKQFLGK